MTRAERVAVERAVESPPSLEVVAETWITLDSPELHLTLSDGSSVLVRWDVEYACPLLFVASGGEDFLSCTTAQTGVEPDALEPYIERVHQAVLHDEIERLADQWDDGRGS